MIGSLCACLHTMIKSDMTHDKSRHIHLVEASPSLCDLLIKFIIGHVWLSVPHIFDVFRHGLGVNLQA
jgi:hypothetical protein